MNLGTKRPIDWKKYAAVTVSVSAALFALWILLRYGIGLLMPFLLAWVLSLLLNPLSHRLAERTRLPRKLWGALLLVLTLALSVLAVAFGVNRLFREVEELLKVIGEDPERIGGIIQQMVEYFSKIGEKLPFLSVLGEVEALEDLALDVGELVNTFLSDTLAEVSARIPSIALTVIGKTPSVLLFLLVFLISAFYFCLDEERIYRGICEMLPASWQGRVSGLRTRLSSLLYRYLRVYLLLFLLTFAELLIGFLVLGRQYAFLAALLISALDILPVLGVGTVLLPWSVILLLTKDFHGAIGLLILWGVVTIVRQIVEPRLIGDSFGIHPVAALAALYAGLRLFGFVGLFVGPAVAVFVKLALTELKRKPE